MDDDELKRYERGLRRGQTTKMVLFIALACSPFLYLGYRVVAVWHHNHEVEAEQARAEELDPGEADELARLVAAIPPRVQKATATWRAAVTRDKLRDIDVDDAGAPPCSERVDELSVKVPRGQEVGTSRDIDDVARQQIELADRIAAGSATRSDLAAARDLQRIAPSAILLVAVDTKPLALAGGVTATGSFVSGVLRGDVFVFDHDRGRVVCAGTIDVSNSASVSAEYSYHPDFVGDDTLSANRALQGELESDLQKNITAALHSSLHEVRATPP